MTWDIHKLIKLIKEARGAQLHKNEKNLKPEGHTSPVPPWIYEWLAITKWLQFLKTNTLFHGRIFYTQAILSFTILFAVEIA